MKKFGLLDATKYDQHKRVTLKNQQKDTNTKIANSGIYVNYLAPNHPSTRCLSNAELSVCIKSNLPPNLEVIQISRQITHFNLSIQRFKATLVNTSENSDSENPKENSTPDIKEDLKPVPKMEKAGSDSESSTIPKLEKSSESSELLGYTDMEKDTPKDQNHNETGKSSQIESDILTIDLTSDSNLESESEKLSKIITETREIATAIFDVLDATTESGGDDVTPEYLAECDKIMKLGNDVRDPDLAERVKRRQSLNLPPSPPQSSKIQGQKAMMKKMLTLEHLMRVKRMTGITQETSSTPQPLLTGTGMAAVATKPPVRRNDFVIFQETTQISPPAFVSVIPVILALLVFQ